MFRRAAAAILVATLVGSACGDDTPAPAIAQEFVGAGLPWPSQLSAEHQDWSIEIVGQLPHDAAAFTQGLEYIDGELIESTGRRGQSTVRRVGSGGEVLASAAMDDHHYGEGLSVVDGQVIQLTWEEGEAVIWDYPALTRSGSFLYEGEGWGLCHDGATFWMSDGSSTLTERNPETFEVLTKTVVRRNGVEIDQLNELECIGDHVVANVWKSDEILVIDPSTGVVQATIDASALRARIQPTDDQAVLNGIADIGDGTLLLGGKLWPIFFVVELVS